MALELINPYNQSLIRRLEYHTGDALETKVEAASRAFGRWRTVPLQERIEQVEEGLRRFRANADAIAADVTRQMGKPLAQAEGEVRTLFQRAEHMLAIAPDALAPDVQPEADGLHRRIEHVPMGVVLDIAAWNYPLIIAVNVIVPALVAGNSVLVKHSAKTPLCGQAFEDAFGHLDVPDLVQNVVITHPQTAELIADPRVAYVSFTGSVDGGRAVHGEVARRFIDVGLELGGKDPAYVAADADLEAAIAGTVDGACYNAGQSCCAVERVYVHRSRYDEYLEGARVALEAYAIGDPMDSATTLGPLASRSALDFLEGQVQDALDRGGRLVTGGGRYADPPGSAGPGNFFQPTLLADVPNGASAMQDESFGPILPVLAVDDDDGALRHMNDTAFGLTASVWTADRDRAEHFARHLDAGTIYQNRCDVLDPALPWSGYRDSGKGSTLSRYGYFHLTRRKALNFRG